MNRNSIYISIPTPCHESWDSMDATERGAFCHSCQKEVIDFTAMTDREVIDYLAKYQTGCGRFRKDQLDTKLTIPKVDNGLFRWKALFLSFLSLVSIKSVVAQPSSKPSRNQISAIQNQNSNPTTGADSSIHISGKVIDESGEALIGANVLLVDSLGKSTGIGVCTGMEGDFSIYLDRKMISDNIHEIKISYAGYYSNVRTITEQLNQNFTIRLRPKTNENIKVVQMKTMGLFNVNEVQKDSLKH